MRLNTYLKEFKRINNINTFRLYIYGNGTSSTFT